MGEIFKKINEEWKEFIEIELAGPNKLKYEMLLDDNTKNKIVDLEFTETSIDEINHYAWFYVEDKKIERKCVAIIDNFYKEYEIIGTNFSDTELDAFELILKNFNILGKIKEISNQLTKGANNEN